MEFESEKAPQEQGFSKRDSARVPPKSPLLENVEAVSEARASASEKIYDLKWSQYFPLDTQDEGIQISYSGQQESLHFIAENFAKIYSEPNPFLSADSSSAKLRYYEDYGDFFLFHTHRKQPIGVFVGTPIDWSTYYFRNCSILPEFQGRKLYQKLLVYLIQILKDHGVQRVEGSVSPSHLGHIHILNKLEFNVSGVNLSERWGALLQFTKFLSGPHEQKFLDQFCHGARPQKDRQVVNSTQIEERNLK